MIDNVIGFLAVSSVFLALGALMFVAVGSAASWFASLQHDLHQRKSLFLELDDQEPYPFAEQPSTSPLHLVGQAMLAQTPPPHDVPREQLEETLQQQINTPARRTSGHFIDAVVSCEGTQIKLQSLHCDQIFPLRFSMQLRGWTSLSGAHQRLIRILCSQHQLERTSRAIRTTINNSSGLARHATRLYAMLDIDAHQARSQRELLDYLQDAASTPPTPHDRRLHFGYLCALLFGYSDQCEFDEIVATIAQEGPFERWLLLAIFLKPEPGLLKPFLDQTTLPGIVPLWQRLQQLDTYRTLTSPRQLSHTTCPTRLISSFVSLLQLLPQPEFQRVQGVWELLEDINPLATHHPYLRRSLHNLKARLQDPFEERTQRLRGGLSVVPCEAKDGGLSLITPSSGQLSLALQEGDHELQMGQ